MAICIFLGTIKRTRSLSLSVVLVGPREAYRCALHKILLFNCVSCDTISRSTCMPLYSFNTHAEPAHCLVDAGLTQTVFFTSLRKGCTLVLSYLLFPKPLTLQHFVGGGLIGAGILLNDKVRS